MPTGEARTETGRLSHFEAMEYLANLRALSSELERAMTAVVNRELPSLQDSIRTQRETCDRLAYFKQGGNTRLLESLDADTSALRPDISTEINAAVETLLALNKTYSALLRHSGDTLRMFAGLFQQHHPMSPVSAGKHASLRTWSCEL